MAVSTIPKPLDTGIVYTGYNTSAITLPATTPTKVLEQQVSAGTYIVCVHGRADSFTNGLRTFLGINQEYGDVVLRINESDNGYSLTKPIKMTNAGTISVYIYCESVGSVNARGVYMEIVKIK